MLRFIAETLGKTTRVLVDTVSETVTDIIDAPSAFMNGYEGEKQADEHQANDVYSSANGNNQTNGSEQHKSPFNKGN